MSATSGKQLALALLTGLGIAGCGGGSDDNSAGTDAAADAARQNTDCLPEPGSPAADVPQLRRKGRWLVDQHNRVVLSHGVNLVWKLDPFVPPDKPAGFTAGDAAWLADHGFNTARIGTLWVGVTPDKPSVVDTGYLDAWQRVVDLLAEQQIWMLFDFHQDMLGSVYQGEGVPEYAILEGGLSSALLPPPRFGFPFNYFTAQVSAAYDNLWAAGPNSDAWTGYRNAWKAVAKRWYDQPYVMGYDLLNEPWAGREYLLCILSGCPRSNAREIQPFFEHAIDGIRTVDADNIVWMEPQLLAGGTGSPSGFTSIEGENQLGYSVHNYCPLSAFTQAIGSGLLSPILDQLPSTCRPFESRVFDEARATADRIGAVDLITEFGATDDTELLRRVTNMADAHLTGWQYWAYKNWNDPTTQSQETGAQGLFADDADRSTAKQAKLDILERTYPQATAGIPQALSFDPDTGAFHYRYETRPANAPTKIYVPQRHYPDGYAVEVSGATITSEPGATKLILQNQTCRGGTVEVSITQR